MLAQEFIPVGDVFSLACLRSASGWSACAAVTAGTAAADDNLGGDKRVLPPRAGSPGRQQVTTDYT